MIDKAKTYKTRDGREVKIFMTDAGGVYPVIGAATVKDGWGACEWTEQGKFFTWAEGHSNDLIEVVPDNMRFINIYKESGHPDLAQADSWARNTNQERLYVLKINTTTKTAEVLK